MSSGGNKTTMKVSLTIVVSSNSQVKSMSSFNSIYFAFEIGFCSSPLIMKK